MWVRSLMLILATAPGLLAQLSVSTEIGLEVAPNFWTWHGAGSNSGGLEAKTGKIRFQSDAGAWGFLLLEARLRVPDSETEPELHALYVDLIAPENFPSLGPDAGHSPPEVPGSHCIVSRLFLEQVGVLPFLPDSLGIHAARRYYQPILVASENNPAAVPREWNVQAPVWLAQELPGIGLGQGQGMADYWRPAAASSTDFTRLDFRLLWERAISSEIPNPTGARTASAFFKNATNLNPANYGDIFRADSTWHDCAAIVGLELNLQFVAFRAAEAIATPSELTTPGVAVSIGTVDMGLSAPLIVTMPSTGAAGLPLGIEIYETAFQCRVGVKKTIFASGTTGSDSTITFELPVPPLSLGLNQGNQLTTFVTVDAARAQWGRVSFTFPNLGYTGPARIVSTTNHFGSLINPTTPGAWPITILP